TSGRASRGARATTLAPGSCPPNPGFATTILSMVAGYSDGPPGGELAHGRPAIFGPFCIGLNVFPPGGRASERSLDFTPRDPSVTVSRDIRDVRPAYGVGNRGILSMGNHRADRRDTRPVNSGARVRRGGRRRAEKAPRHELTGLSMMPTFA